MVPFVKIVFTTLAILNYIGIVSPKDELEHGLATGCGSKGMNAEMVKSCSKLTMSIAF